VRPARPIRACTSKTVSTRCASSVVSVDAKATSWLSRSGDVGARRAAAARLHRQDEAAGGGRNAARAVRCCRLIVVFGRRRENAPHPVSTRLRGVDVPRR
jgi:hypothetical protein